MSWWTKGGFDACRNASPLQLSIGVCLLSVRDNAIPFCFKTQ